MIIHPRDFNSYINKPPPKEKSEVQNDLEILCNCTKSNCTKKYCECFKAGEGCKELCRCINCENDKKLSSGYSNIRYALSEDHPGEKNNSGSQEKRNVNRNPMNYVLEGTSVYICNQDITVSFRKEILNKKKENDNGIFKNNASYSDHVKINENVDTAADSITKVMYKFGFSEKKKNQFIDMNSDSKVSSNINEKDIYSHDSSIAKEVDSNSADKNTFNPNLETPNIKRKRKRITKADSVSKSNSKYVHTPLFATSTTSTHKKSNNRKIVNLDQQIIKKLDKIY